VSESRQGRGVEGQRRGELAAHLEKKTGLGRDEGALTSRLVRSLVGLIVRLAAGEEVRAAVGVLHVLDADVDALPSDATTNL
jgi:hypothetical protein